MLLSKLRRLTGYLRHSPPRDDHDRRHEPTTAPAPAEAAPAAAGFGVTGEPLEQKLNSMTEDELTAWENRDVPTIARVSDVFEAKADERRDPMSSLSFPLHWTTARESFDYLFDFAIASELLGPRPDDLILDFAAGTCWATELLSRLGVRTVSIDLSVEMMRRGRSRLAADSRIIFRDQAYFVAARGQQLPFANGVFDGVLCLNALHHHPSYAVALREIHRVLKPGGRAVFSEPGSAHAVQPLSAFRMREEQIIEKPVSLPHVRRLAFEAGFTRMRVVPLRSAGSYAFEYEARSADAARLRQMWSDTTLHSPREHARFVLHKGDDPPVDTLLPAHQLVGRLNAHIEVEPSSPVVQQGQAFTDRLRIANTGTVTWKAKGRRFGGQVTCGLKICTPTAEVLREDLGRTSLPHDVAPGGQVTVDVAVAGELRPGRYTLRYDMVVEGVTWFESHGSMCYVRHLEVLPL
ncbi:MAG: class I SAM-dependent methyltransferase [Vicinamibacterales bacterium]